MGDDFRRGYADKSGQECEDEDEDEDEAKRKALRVCRWSGKMGVERRALFRELKENSWKEGRALEETMERSAGVAWEGSFYYRESFPFAS